MLWYCTFVYLKEIEERRRREIGLREENVITRMLVYMAARKILAK